MASAGPPGMGGFFGGMLGDLLKLLKTDAPLQWDLALQLGEAVAGEGDDRANVEPVERIRAEELGHLAERHVADAMGMSTTPSGNSLQIIAANRTDWARSSLENWRPLFESVAQALGPSTDDLPTFPTDLEDGEDDDGEELGAFLNQWAQAIGPAMIGMQVGSIVGHLARRSLGQYDLPLSRTDGESILVVPHNAKSFAEDWSLPPDDVALYLASKDIALHSLLSKAHVRERLFALIIEHAKGFRPDRHALEALLGEASPGELGDINALTQILSNPAALGQMSDTAAVRQANAELDALVTAIIGYSEHILDEVSARTIGSRQPVREALKRRRVERGEDERGVEALLGIHLDQDVFDRGEAFINGVLERGGQAELTTMFVIEANLPTPAEIGAPGLWLERIHLPLDEGPADEGEPQA